MYGVIGVIKLIFTFRKHGLTNLNSNSPCILLLLFFDTKQPEVSPSGVSLEICDSLLVFIHTPFLFGDFLLQSAHSAFDIFYLFTCKVHSFSDPGHPFFRLLALTEFQQYPRYLPLNATLSLAPETGWVRRVEVETRPLRPRLLGEVVKEPCSHGSCQAVGLPTRLFG